MLAGIAAVVTGCSLSPFHQVVEALGKSEATVCFRSSHVTIAGTSHIVLYRANIHHNGEVLCTDERMSVHSRE